MHDRDAARGRHQDGPWLARGLSVEGRARYLAAEDRLWDRRSEAEVARLLGPRGTDPRKSAATITAVRRHASALLVRIGVRSPGIPHIEPAPETPLT